MKTKIDIAQYGSRILDSEGNTIKIPKYVEKRMDSKFKQRIKRIRYNHLSVERRWRSIVIVDSLGNPFDTSKIVRKEYFNN